MKKVASLNDLKKGKIYYLDSSQYKFEGVQNRKFGYNIRAMYIFRPIERLKKSLSIPSRTSLAFTKRDLASIIYDGEVYSK
jgi:hypothetical protein